MTTLISVIVDSVMQPKSKIVGPKTATHIPKVKKEHQ